MKECLAVRFLSALLFLLLLTSGTSGFAQPPLDGVRGWQQQTVAAPDSTPQSIDSLTQTRDGFIWIAAFGGLFRYDGVSFDRVAIPVPKLTWSGSMSTLLPLANGDLLVGHLWGGLTIVHSGRARPLRAMIGTPFCLAESGNGVVWSVQYSIEGLSFTTLVKRKWTEEATEPTLLSAFSGCAVNDSGVLVYLVNGSLRIISPGDHRSKLAARAAPDAKIVQAPDRRIWLWSARRLRQVFVSRSGNVTLGPSADIPMTDVSGLVIDRQNGAWLVDKAGVLKRFELRPTARGMSAWNLVGQTKVGPSREFGILTLVDRENNVWFGTSKGLQWYRRTAFTQPTELISNGSVEFDNIAIRDGLGEVWLRRRHDLFRVDQSGRLRKQPVHVPLTYQPCGSRDGGVWLTNKRSGLTLYGGSTRRSLSLSGTTTFARTIASNCVEDSLGRLWVDDTERLKILGTKDAKPVPRGRDQYMGDVTTVAADQHGRVIFYMNRGSVYRSNGTRLERLWPKQRMSVGFAEVIYQTAGYLFIGGDRGLVRYDGRSFKLITSERFPFLENVSGIVQTPSGETWIHSLAGVTRVRTAALNHAFDSRNAKIDAKTFGIADGLPGGPVYWNMSSIVSDAAGRIWAMTLGGIAVLDPSELTPNRVPPPVEVLRVFADGKHFDPIESLHLPAGSQRVRIDFAGLSFVDPAKVKFRYKLLGVDRSWVDGGTTRSATYTFLAPGMYRFRVLAANNDGLWNQQGAELTFVVPPTFLQSRLFYVACGIGMAIILALAFRWRLTYLTRQIRERMRVQTFERERIAQDLHDTLLQSVQGMIMRFHGLSLRPGLDHGTRHVIGETLDEAEAALVESREHVAGLRSARIVALHSAVEIFAEKLRKSAASEIIVAVSGDERIIEPIVADEAAKIAAEALLNAVRHAGASTITVGVEYLLDRLVVRIEDDGAGIPAQILADGGRQGHFGLKGMKERAAYSGGTLDVQTGGRKGTSVILEVPARYAYGRVRGRKWLGM